MKEFHIITDKHWCKALAENYPDFTMEADMTVKELMEMGYWYDDLIPRRETPMLTARVIGDGNRQNVYVSAKDGWEYLGYVTDAMPDVYSQVRVDGGQMIRIKHGEHRDRKIEESVPYTFVLVQYDKVQIG